MGFHWLIVVALLFVVFWISCAIYRKLVVGKCTSKALLTGKTVLITGADKGIGYETALDLARRNARVIMACRDMVNAEKAASKIKLETGNHEVHLKKIDVSSLANVNDFVKKFLKDEDKLHILINNAGIPNDSFSLVRTCEGFEKIFVTNYLGHFLLTLQLLDLIKKSSPSRIINVSSLAHQFVWSLDTDDLNCEKSQNATLAYGISKLLQILYSLELTKHLKGTGVTINSLHPGTVWTNFSRRLPRPFRELATFFVFFVCRSAKDGAQTSIHLACSDELEGVSGKYFSECQESSPSKLATDSELAKKVFEASQRYCNQYL